MLYLGPVICSFDVQFASHQSPRVRHMLMSAIITKSCHKDHVLEYITRKTITCTNTSQIWSIFQPPNDISRSMESNGPRWSLLEPHRAQLTVSQYSQRSWLTSPSSSLFLSFLSLPLLCSNLNYKPNKGQLARVLFCLIGGGRGLKAKRRKERNRQTKDCQEGLRFGVVAGRIGQIWPGLSARRLAGCNS